MEGWILVATREVPEQLEQSLNLKGELLGVPIVILDWKSQGIAPLAALCALAPDLVESFFSADVASLARTLQPAAADAIEQLRLDLEAWRLGFEAVRRRSHLVLEKIWFSPRASHATLGQNAAGGAEDRKIRRQQFHDSLTMWWNGPAKSDAPAAVVGWDGVGKTWATLDWLVDRRELLPIVLVVPASASAEIFPSETAVKRFLADRLYEVTCVRDRDHWLRRLDNLLKRPGDEGPVLTIFFDGLNQEPSVAWLQILKILQGETFEGRTRIILTTRTHYYENKLGELRGLMAHPVLAHLGPYDKSRGGELDQMLAFENLTQDDLHPDLIELARTPRLFRLVVKFRSRLMDPQQVTIHRLLWEYGRDSFGERTGSSFSEHEWRSWLQEIARKHRDGVREFSLKTLGETASRADLSQREVYARLSNIIDGQFTVPNSLGSLQLKPTVVAHALGAALLAVLDDVPDPTFDKVNAQATKWLDPIGGLDQRSEILRAAVSIHVERGGASTAPIASVLVTDWLQTQNITDTHRRELAALAPNFPEALLSAIEHSVSQTQASARILAVSALRAITRSNIHAMTAIVAKARYWCSMVSRDVPSPSSTDTEAEKSRSEHFMTRVGRDASGPLQVLGLELYLVDRDDGVLSATVPSILEGFPISKALPVFEAAAVAQAVARWNSSWEGLKWLCLLNEVDAVEATSALRSLSVDMSKRIPESGVNSALPARVASLLRRLTGEEEDETSAVDLNPALGRSFTYVEDYLNRPSRSLYALERRHSQDALNDVELPLLTRIQRTRDLWIDPTFKPPPGFVQELRLAVANVGVEKLGRYSSYTIEDHDFEELEPVLARCAPDVLADLIRRRMRSYRTCPPESRYWVSIRSTEHLILAGEPESAAARVLRLSSHEKTDNEEVYAANQLLILELHDQAASAQADIIIDAALEEILIGIGEILRPLTSEEADALIGRFRSGSPSQQRDLLILLSHNAIVLSDTAWSWLIENAFDVQSHSHLFAYRTLSLSDASRFGRELFARDWTWSATAHYWVNHYGSGALIDGTRALPFEEVAPRLAPWRVLEAAIRRGADGSEVRLAAIIVGQILAGARLEAPDPGSTLSMDRTTDEFGPMFSVMTRQSEDNSQDSFAALQAAMDIDTQVKAHKKAIETAAKRIREAREAGASLYLVNLHAEDMDPVLLHAPDLVENWMEGCSKPTSDFKRRVRLAEAAYLALCDTLMKQDAVRGVELWRSLNQALTTQFIGAARVDDLIHMPFRAPNTPAAMGLQTQLLELKHCHTDKELLNLAIAVSFNGKADWLSTIIEKDTASPLPWRRKRATVLEGFTCYNELPITEAWPDGEIRTSSEELRRKSARHRYREACARHWWRAYLASKNQTEAYATWVLFLRSADRRAWVWISDDAERVTGAEAFCRLKMLQFRLNRSKLWRAMEKHEEGLDKHFLNRKIVGGVGPWATYPS
jgi:hypothetical protein